NRKFSGFLSIQDPNLNATYDGSFDFSKEPYHLHFESSVKHINLDYLGVTKNLNARARANISGDFTIRTLDDFLGNLALSDVHFDSKRETLDIAEASIISSVNQGTQNLELDVPGFLQGEVHGKYKLSQLADAMMNAVGSTTLMTYEPKPVDP